MSNKPKTIKQLRNERKLTQLDLAYKLGVSLSTVTGIETGRQEPRVGLAQKIAEVLGVSVDEIAWSKKEENDPNLRTSPVVA